MARIDSPMNPLLPTLLDDESAPTTQDMAPSPRFPPAPAVPTAVDSSTHYDPIDAAPRSGPGAASTGTPSIRYEYAATSARYGEGALSGPFSGAQRAPLDDGAHSARAPAQRSWSGPPPPMDDGDELVGTTLCETYTIRRVVGEGGMGRVYEAHHTRIANKRFAIKTLHPEFARKREVISRFKREAEATASLSSPHVVGVYDVDRTPDGRPFLVGEFLDGEELGDVLDRVGKLEVPRAVRIVRQVCKGLAAAHEKSIVHRDVKPENVFLVGDPRDPVAKVLDFGISRITQGEEGTNLTKTGMVIGTPAYMSPEQARGAKVDHRADIYGVGAILYAALTGKVPFERDDPAATVVAVLTQEPERPRALEPSIPEHLEFVIQKAMAREPEDRYQNMQDLDEALAPYDPRERGQVAMAGTVLATMPDDQGLVRDARPLLVLLVLVLLLSLVSGLVTATAALMRLFGALLTPTETAVILIGGGLGLVTPLVLIVRHIKRTAWNSSLRALELMHSLQRPLIVAACTYGFSGLFARFVHHVIYPNPDGVALPLWDLSLFAVAVLAGGAVALMNMSSKRKDGSGGTAIPLPHPFALSLLLCTLIAGVVTLPILLQDDGAGAEPAPSLSLGETRADEADDAPPESRERAESPAQISRDSATTDELEKAKAGGGEALAALAQRYPSDPTVLTSLMVEQATTTKGLGDALGSAEKLVGIRPAATKERDLRETLLRAVDAGGELSSRAFDFMATKMDSDGPDLIYVVMESRPLPRARAVELLSSEDVRKRATPALLIAFDLSLRKGCARVQLLDRAAKDGDARAAKQLQPLIVKKNRGCGFLGLKGCPAPCRKDEVAIRKALAEIDARSSK